MQLPKPNRPKIQWMSLVKYFLIPFLLFILTNLASFTIGFMARPYLEDNEVVTYPLFDEAISLLSDKGLKDMPDATSLQYGMIRGALEVYDDPYTVLVEPVQNELQSNELQGKYGGIGVRLERDSQNHVIIHPLPESPAVASGLVDGDYLLSVDDLVIEDTTSLDSISAAVSGPVGDIVRIGFAHAPDYTPQEVEIKRAEIAQPSVTWNPSVEDPSIGIIQVTVIAATSEDEIKNAVSDLQNRGCTHFVLDLRNNGGGLLDAGIDIARLFLSEGTVISEQYRGEEQKVFSVETSGEYTDIPLVVWVNHNTASAAEIIAGAIQANGRAKLLGVPTYGKDTIQLVYNLTDGSSLHITAAHWWFADQTEGIAATGLQPDVLIQEDPAQPSALLNGTQSIFAGN